MSLPLNAAPWLLWLEGNLAGTGGQQPEIAGSDEKSLTGGFFRNVEGVCVVRIQFKNEKVQLQVAVMSATIDDPVAIYFGGAVLGQLDCRSRWPRIGGSAPVWGRGKATGP
ncbi:hypothetical protein DESC_150054 [Desulfosarcina cetonica]|nr:hypothetical protein DESC_150054 [Desulfosarcina cetonica]